MTRWIWIKKHMSLRGGAEESIKVTSIKVTNLYVVRFFAIALNDKVFIDYYYFVTQRELATEVDMDKNICHSE